MSTGQWESFRSDPKASSTLTHSHNCLSRMSQNSTDPSTPPTRLLPRNPTRTVARITTPMENSANHSVQGTAHSLIYVGNTRTSPACGITPPPSPIARRMGTSSRSAQLTPTPEEVDLEADSGSETESDTSSISSDAIARVLRFHND